MYTVEGLYKKAIKVIDEHGLYFIEDVIAFMPCVKSTFYDIIKTGTDESNDIKRALEENRIKEKIYLRKEFKKGASVEKIALYKLLANEHELKALNSQYLDHTTKGEKVTTPVMVFRDLSKEDEE